MNKYIEYYKKEILDNQKLLFSLIDKITSDTPMKQVKKLVTALSLTSTCMYSSYKLEEFFINKAKKVKIDLDNKYMQNSTLHVLTQAYDSGGHTRVVEHWIENAPAHQHHYVYITNQKEDEVSKSLQKYIKDKDRIYIETNTDDIKSALKLRKIASKFETVILHIHMDDIVPLLAFGTEDFKRPVLFYNHADHLGWVGISIADIVLELREFGIDITKNRRGCERQHKLGIPIYNPVINNLKTKKDLNLPDDKLIIFSCGSQHKYIPVQDINIFDLIKYITQKYNVMFVIVGINNIEKFNIAHYGINQEQLLILNEMNHHDLISYINSADIVLDSFPMSGATALTDAVALGKPIISGCSLVGQLDYITKSPYYCKNMDELKTKLEELITDENKRVENVKLIKKLIAQNDSLECFKNNLLEIENIKPQKHSVYMFNEIIADEIIENDVYRYIYSTKRKVVLDIYWLKIIKYKNKLRKYIIISIFSKDFKISYSRI